MRVRAKSVSENGKENRVVGYFGDRRIREGQIFTLVPRKRKDGTIESVEQQFSKNWMEQVDRMPVSRPAQPQKTLGGSGPVAPVNDDPLGSNAPNEEEAPSDDLESQPGSDNLPGQPGGSNSDVI